MRVEGRAPPASSIAIRPRRCAREDLTTLASSDGCGVLPSTSTSRILHRVQLRTRVVEFARRRAPRGRGLMAREVGAVTNCHRETNRAIAIEFVIREKRGASREPHLHPARPHLARCSNGLRLRTRFCARSWSLKAIVPPDRGVRGFPTAGAIEGSDYGKPGPLTNVVLRSPCLRHCLPPSQVDVTGISLHPSPSREEKWASEPSIRTGRFHSPM